MVGGVWYTGPIVAMKGTANAEKFEAGSTIGEKDGSNMGLMRVLEITGPRVCSNSSQKTTPVEANAGQEEIHGGYVSEVYGLTVHDGVGFAMNAFAGQQEIGRQLDSRCTNPFKQSFSNIVPLLDVSCSDARVARNSLICRISSCL